VSATRGSLLLRGLLVVLGALIAFFCFWGAWEMARQFPSAPQAILPALVFAAFGAVALLAGAATFLWGPEVRGHEPQTPRPPAPNA
jgi:hypothetical protein